MSGSEIRHLEWAFDSNREAYDYARKMNSSPESEMYRVYCIPYWTSSQKMEGIDGRES